VKIFGIIGGVLFVLFALYFLWGYSHSESYCFFRPGIDTQYAAGYSEQAFSQISTGMTVQVVQQKLGAPLYVQTNRQNGRLEWYYTRDGKCKWGDWAWLVRVVYFTDGRVSELVRRVAYD
jgi:outer membrane protein assembly factor BamE (lipoprotein component of BamABCDE complex)